MIAVTLEFVKLLYYLRAVGCNGPWFLNRNTAFLGHDAEHTPVELDGLECVLFNKRLDLGSSPVSARRGPLKSYEVSFIHGIADSLEVGKDVVVQFDVL